MGSRTLSIGIVALVLASACHSGPSSTTTTTSSRAVDSGAAWARMTRARCDREDTCDHIGRGRAYANRAACEQELRARANTELLTRSCPRGIDEHNLEECLSDVRKESCGNPWHTADLLDRCSDGQLCVTD